MRRLLTVKLSLSVLVGASFCGMAGGLPPLPDGAFTYVVLPDTQLYHGKGSNSDPSAPTSNPAFRSRMDWILGNLERERIVFVSHVGDIVDRRTPFQWRFASDLVAELDGKVPFGLSVGNHDAEDGDAVRSGFVGAFPAKRYADYPWYVGNFGDNANSCQLFEAGGFKFVVLHLECNSPELVLSWADSMLEKYADRHAVIVTHMYLGYLTREQDRLRRGMDLANPPGYGDWFGVMNWSKVHGKDGVSPQRAWDICFSRHRNLFLILCGDQSMATTWRQLQFGSNGNWVYSVLQDYPRTADREDWLRLLRFVPSRGEIQVLTYSPCQDRLCDDAGFWHGEQWHQFVLTVPWLKESPTEK